MSIESEQVEEMRAELSELGKTLARIADAGERIAQAVETLAESVGEDGFVPIAVVTPDDDEPESEPAPKKRGGK
jgi:hypothetical protein